MNTVEIIRKKREGESLTNEEIEYLVLNFTLGRIPSYQFSAFLMAGFLNGLTKQETAQLTRSMLYSGKVINLNSIKGKKIDKHSTGGVGDKVTLIIGPLLAAAGIFMPKLSGRGLGWTGGTIDKLESISGFNCNISVDHLMTQTRRIGLAIGAQTSELAPLDGKLYAMRDVTATVDSLPLIAASVMSKKIAAGAKIIILDVTCGAGAFMSTREEAAELASLMVKIGSGAGRLCLRQRMGGRPKIRRRRPGCQMRLKGLQQDRP